MIKNDPKQVKFTYDVLKMQIMERLNTEISKKDQIITFQMIIVFPFMWIIKDSSDD